MHVKQSAVISLHAVIVPSYAEFKWLITTLLNKLY